MGRDEEIGGVMGVKVKGPDLMVRSTGPVDGEVFLAAGGTGGADLVVVVGAAYYTDFFPNIFMITHLMQ